MSAKTLTYLSIATLAGLGWERSPARLSERTFGVRWDDAFAPLTNQEHADLPALLSLLHAGIPAAAQSDTILFAYADSATEGYFGALTSGGKPVLEAEHVFETREQLLAWLAGEIAQDGLQGLALSAELTGEINSTLPVYDIDAPSNDFAPACATGRSTQINFGSMISGKKRIALVAAVFGLVPLIGLLYVSFNSEGTAETPQAVQMKTVFSGRDERALLESCAQAFSASWPIGPGWTRDVSGCTAQGMRVPTGVLSSEPVAFQVYRLRAGWDVTVARKAARVVLKESDVSVSGNENTLIVTRPISAPEQRRARAPAPITGADLQADLEAAFLGRARSVRSLGDEQEITLWGSIADVTTTLANFPHVQLNRLDSRDGLVTAIVGPKRAVALKVPFSTPITEEESLN